MQLMDTAKPHENTTKKIEYWWQTPVLNRRAWTWEDARNV